MKRRELHLPLTCALLGALVAICWGMVHLQSDYDRTRVHLERSLPLAVLGVVCGALVGRGLQRAATARPAIGVLLEAALVPALAAGIAGPVGWLFRDAAADWSGETAILRAAAWGAVAGLTLYGATRAYRGICGATVAAEPARAPDGGGGDAVA